MEKTNRRIFWLYFLAVSTWIVLYLTANNKAYWDLWGVMSFGALLDQNPHFFPYRDVFSYTAFGRPWIYHEWGSGVIFFQLFKHFGSSALFVLKLVLVEVIFLLSCQPLFKKRSEPSAALTLGDWVLLLCLPIAAYLMLPIVSTTIRCLLFTFLGYALFLMILERHKQYPTTRSLWLLPFLMIIWVNIHGGFITGIVAIGAYLLHYWLQNDTRATKQLAGVFALSSVALLMNPYALTFLQAMTSAWSLPRTEISEWGNVFTLEIPFYGAMYSFLLLGATGLGFWQWRKAPNRFSGMLLLLIFSGIYGWLHYKLAPLFLITLLSLGPEFIPPWKPNLVPWARSLAIVIGYAVPVLLACIGLGTTAFYVQSHPKSWIVQVQGSETIRENLRITRFAYPIGVVNFLRDNHIHGNLWTPFAIGEFLYWTLYPNMHVSIDGRYDTVYPQSVFNAYYSFYHAPYSLANATQFPTTHILIPRRRTELIAQLNQSTVWRVIYQDAMSVLYARVPSQTSPQPQKTAISYPSISRPMDDFLGDLTRFRLPANQLLHP